MEPSRFFDDLQRRIDPERESSLYREWASFLDRGTEGQYFSPARTYRSAAGIEWPKIPINHAIRDESYDSMIVRELAGCSGALETGSGAILAVRSNYGTSIIPSLFDAELFFQTDEQDTLPTSYHLPDGIDGMQRLLDRGVPDIRRGLCAHVFSMAEKFLEVRAGYRSVREHVHLYHPDLQSPMDLLEVMWGSSLFLDIYDRPDIVHGMLRLLTDTYAEVMDAWLELVPYEEPFSVHWQMLQKGCIMLRSDSAMNFSPEMYDEFIRPYDQELLNRYGGGAVHFCGRGSHYISSLSSMNGAFVVNLSQPEYNDMATILESTVAKDLRIIGFPAATADELVDQGCELRGKVHVR